MNWRDAIKWYIDRFLKGLPAIPAGLLCLVLDLCYAAVVYLTIGIIPIGIVTILTIPLVFIIDDYDARITIVRILFTIANTIALPTALVYAEECGNKKDDLAINGDSLPLFVLIVFSAMIVATWVF
jgi:hypothetical protein